MVITINVKKGGYPNFRKFETDKRISNTDALFTNTSGEEDKKRLLWIGDNGKSIIEELFASGLIGDIMISSDKISIQKKTEAQWPEIEEKLMAILAKLYGESKFSFWTQLSRKIQAKT